MKFMEPARAPDGLTSYARIGRVRPGITALNIVEGLFGLTGVVLIVLVIRYGSFEKAGLAIDEGIHGVASYVVKLTNGSGHK